MKLEGETIGASPRKEEFKGVTKWLWAGVSSCLCRFPGERNKCLSLTKAPPGGYISWELSF